MSRKIVSSRTNGTPKNDVVTAAPVSAPACIAERFFSRRRNIGMWQPASAEKHAIYNVRVYQYLQSLHQSAIFYYIMSLISEINLCIFSAERIIFLMCGRGVAYMAARAGGDIGKKESDNGGADTAGACSRHAYHHPRQGVSDGQHLCNGAGWLTGISSVSKEKSAWLGRARRESASSRAVCEIMSGVEFRCRARRCQ